ncbi:glycosyltransferase [Flavobacterium sp. GA093]|uniref:Glycosyltransferase n=1 Tax=Flavobacterium hydrocarbonoxydans TaxID=2683249 RepID=A0A6I4NQJ4_9FLAO|nr:glycosyltransferase [Flavobacterium hydrocarbonoxydans]MWB96520.1 glycosyltransferase [Flavobacterium hydrocarbonoxydans]
MQDNSLVTIICLCYNQEKFVIESLLSVIKQDYPLIELIVVDDCSSDNSKSAIKNWLTTYPNVQFIANETNLGNTKSFNKALKFAKGDYIIDLAADDVLLPNCISQQVKTFEVSTLKNLGIVYGNAELISENGTFESYFFPVDLSKKTIEKRQTGDIYLSVLEGGNSICSVSAMMKKTVFDELKGYDENLAYEDLDFWIRASRLYQFDFIDCILIQKRISDTSLTSSFYDKNNSRFKKINTTTYLILKKAIHLNLSKTEDLAVQKRVHHEIVHTFQIKDYGLLFKNIGLRLWLFWRINFKKY